MTGDTKPGDASASRWEEKFKEGQQETDLALTRLEVRAEQRSEGDTEDTGVIHVEAARRVAEKESDPPKASSPIQVVVIMARKFPPWGAVIVAVTAIVAYVILRVFK